MTVFLYSPGARQSVEWQPAVDIYKAKWGWILKFELAGVSLADIEVHASQRAIKVSGCRRDWALGESCSHYSMEITYSRFERVVQLPDDLSRATIQTDYRDGILFVRIQVKEEEAK